MRRRTASASSGFWRISAGAVALALMAGASLAQDQKQAPSSPVGGAVPGGAAPGFSTQVKPAPQAVAGITLEPQQIELVNKVSGFFNELQNLRGTFVQTTADNKRLRGKFYVKRPGRLRFEYSLPSKQLIVSDGQQLAIQDLDLKTDDRMGLDQTVFRILLRKDVDLMRDARILEVQEANDLIVLSLQDKSPDTSGRIKLFMAKGPTSLEIKEWVTTDAQGEVRVELSSTNRSEEIDPGLFKIVNPSLQKGN